MSISRRNFLTGILASIVAPKTMVNISVPDKLPEVYSDGVPAGYMTITGKPLSKKHPNADSDGSVGTNELLVDYDGDTSVKLPNRTIMRYPIY